jgi:hypothetical protein
MTVDASDKLADDHLDGNAEAGLLREIFATEFTTVERICQSCGDRNAGGAHRSYLGAGVVLRCPNCGDIALRVVPRDRDCVLDMRGTWIVARPE